MVYHYAYIDENNIVQAVYTMPSQITGANYIQIDSADQSLVGKRYNAETGLFEEVVTAYYYAKLDDRDIVIEIITNNTPLTANDLISIDTEDLTLIDKTYNRETQQFEETPITVLAKHSTDEINVGDENKWLTDELSEINSAIDTIETELDGKAAENHTHNYAATTHNHATTDVTGLESTLTAIENNITALETAVGGKAATGHNHDNAYAPKTHTHSAAEVTGLTDAYSKTETDTKLSEKLNASAYNAADVLAKIKTVDGADSGLDADTLDGQHASDFAAASHTHDYAASNHNHNNDYAAKSHTHTDYLTADAVSGFAIKAEVNVALSGKADADHTHSGFAAENHTHSNYATTTALNALSETVSGKAATSHTHTIANVTGLETALSGKAASNHTHTLDNVSETDGKKIMTAAERTKLNGIAAGANNYTHPTSHPVSMIDGLETALSGKAAASHSHAQSEITGLTDALAGKASTSHTHTAAAVGAAASNHNHDSVYMKKTLQMTADDGNVELSWSGKNIVNEVKALASGMTTVYSPAGATNNPNSSESFRFMIHKTGSANFGWIMAFGSQGSVYTGYVDSGNWKGWKALFEASPSPLWTGGYYMTEGHTITPSKKLSECRNGWILMWSDFDPGEQANNTDFYATVICKKAYAGQNWQGGEWYCDVPRYSAGTATDSESRVIKVLKIYDAKIVGTANNDAAPRNDVVLRAVYEF